MQASAAVNKLPHQLASVTLIGTKEVTPRVEVVGGVQEEQITRNILASWQVQRSMHSEVKKVLEVAKRKKRNERVVRLVDAAANGDVAEVSPPVPPGTLSVQLAEYAL